eukprot:COSAG04_NODE_2397_length_4209_cov_10.504380_5_plen_157_part_00
MNAQFCTPASVTAPLYLKWALVFEDAQTHSIWLGKAIPRLWLRQGERVSAQAVPTGYGRVSFAFDSQLEASGSIHLNVSVPSSWASKAGRGAPPGGLAIRLRAPLGWRMSGVALGDGTAWKGFDADGERMLFSKAQLEDAGVAARLSGVDVRFVKH